MSCGSCAASGGAVGLRPRSPDEATGGTLAEIAGGAADRGPLVDAPVRTPHFAGCLLRWGVRECFAAADLCGLRVLSRSALGSVGRMSIVRHKPQGPRTASADPSDEGSPAVGWGRRFRTRRAMLLQQQRQFWQMRQQRQQQPTGGPVRLRATMRRCLAALRRSQRRLSVAGVSCSSSRARYLVDGLEVVARDVTRGSLRSPGVFALRSRALFAEAAISAKLARELFADAFSWFALLEEVQKEFDAELMLVEVPEVELVRMPVAGPPSLLQGSATVFLGVEMEVLCGQDVRIGHISPRFAWADVTVVAADGAELGTMPCVHPDSVRLDPVGLPQPEPRDEDEDELQSQAGPESVEPESGEEETPQSQAGPQQGPQQEGGEEGACRRKGDPGGRRHAAGARLKFSRRLRCSPAGAAEARLLRELVEGQELKVSLRLEWPILRNSQITLLGCELTLATLQPEF